MIGIIDYGLGNVRAFSNIYHQLSVPHAVVSTPEALEGVSRVILPGVGAFDQAMKRLQSSGMRDVLEQLVRQQGCPVLGVCVGMQILMSASEEGTVPGLSWIDGDVVRFRSQVEGESIVTPHMGWNTVRPASSAALFDGLDMGARFYFLHSYFVRCRSTADVLAVTNYGEDFACAINHSNIYGVQFHPEKSHGYGIRLLKNFAEI